MHENEKKKKDVKPKILGAMRIPATVADFWISNFFLAGRNGGGDLFFLDFLVHPSPIPTSTIDRGNIFGTEAKRLQNI